LLNYGYVDLAKIAMQRWLRLVDSQFVKTQKIFEKYNVVEERDAVDGEYAMQDGFGWTNGITLKFIHLLRELP
jgi:alpha,alpha-trehalase